MSGNGIRNFSTAQPFVSETFGTVTLHFRDGEVQSQMRVAAPDDLVLSYTRAMAAFLLLHRSLREIAILGLGGGSIPKWCYRKLPQAEITVVEINSRVIALRDRFQIPRDDHRFRVLCGNGADYVARTSDRPDVLIVDAFDIDGQPAELCSQSFYDDCYRILDADGLLVVNLCDPHDAAQLARIRGSFADRVALTSLEDGSNKVACAAKSETAWSWQESAAQAEIQRMTGASLRDGLAID